MLTYNVCKKNLNFKDARMKKFLVLTAALLINTRKNNYVQRMQKELEFQRRKDEEILSSDCGVVNKYS